MKIFNFGALYLGAQGAAADKKKIERQVIDCSIDWDRSRSKKSRTVRDNNFPGRQHTHRTYQFRGFGALGGMVESHRDDFF